MTSRAPNPSTGSRKISFNVSEQYDIQDVVGEGAYGVVWYVNLITPPFVIFEPQYHQHCSMSHDYSGFYFSTWFNGVPCSKAIDLTAFRLHSAYLMIGLC